MDDKDDARRLKGLTHTSSCHTSEMSVERFFPVKMPLGRDNDHIDIIAQLVIKDRCDLKQTSDGYGPSAEANQL